MPYRKESLILVTLVLVICAVSVVEASSFPVTDPALNAAGVQQEQGRELTAADWVAHLPLLYAVIALTIVIDAIFIAMIFRNRRKNRNTL
ncbi:hypothetical protein KFU94_30005 [Chloroflexi bacterium TSY]|nr:hypothetical protein [Chloroflexi bacterium TSY]